LLRLQDDFTPANYAGNMENIAPCIDLQFYREDFTFSLWGYTSCSIKYLESPNGKYVQLGKDDFGCLTTFAFIALSVDQLEPFYDVLVEFISKMLPFDLGDIELAGYEDVVRRCEKIICYDNPITMKRHILLAGPPGCGKSMIMKQVAKNHPEYVRCNLTQTKKWLGWIKVFAKILEKCNKKVLLIIDEIDELGLRRDRNGESVYELLRLMDGTENVRNLLIMASTNRVNDLDPALLRAGRFGPVINVDKPNPDQKKAIMEFYCQRYNCRVNIDEIVRTVKGRYSGADIRIAFEDCLIQGVDLSTENVQRNLLEYAVSPGVGRTFSPIQEV
ncbi:ATP-binding protein, partial [bacterium]|nr:ATP-binding protein [bacterium]